MTDEGQAVLKKIAELGADADPLAPWLASQYKKGDLYLEAYDGGDTGYLAFKAFNMGIPLHPLGEVTRRITNWYNATDHPLRQGVNIQEMNAAQVSDMANQHNAQVKAEEKKRNMMEKMKESDAPVVYTFDNGWTIRELHNREHLEEDTLCMGHCVGNDTEYNRRLQNGEIEFFSLRDPDGIAHATWHYNDDGNLEHIQGSSGDPKQEYMDMINEWSEIADRPTNVVGEGNGYDDYYTFYVQSVEDFLAIPDSTWLDLAHEDYNANIGEGTELNYEIDHDAVWKDLKENGLPEASDWETLFKAMVETDVGWWDKTIPSEMESGELESPTVYNKGAGPIEGEVDSGPEIAAWWRGMKAEYTNPYGDTLEPEWPHMIPMNGDNTPLQKWKEENMPPLWTDDEHQLLGEGDFVENGETERKQLRQRYEVAKPWWAEDANPQQGYVDINQPDNLMTKDRAAEQANSIEVKTPYGGWYEAYPDKPPSNVRWFGTQTNR